MMFLGVFLCELQFFRTHVQTEYHLYGGALQEFMTSSAGMLHTDLGRFGVHLHLL